MFGERKDQDVTIARDGGVVTEIEIMKVDVPDRQDSLVDGLLEANAVLARLPGFVSATVLRSSRGSLERLFGLVSAHAQRSAGDPSPARRRVANYVQWESEGLLARARQYGELGARASAYRRFALSAEKRLYDVRFVGHPEKDRDTTLKAAWTGVTAINEVSTTPERQEELLRFMVGVEELAEGVPGYVSTNIHLSRDGWRNLNLVQFESKKTVALGLPRVLWQVVRGRSGTSLRGGMPRVEGLGTSDIHLYEVASSAVAGAGAPRATLR